MIDLREAPGLAGNQRRSRPRGRLVLVGLFGGAGGNGLRAVLRKRLTIVGTTLRARPLEEKIAATRRFASSVVPWLAQAWCARRRFGLPVRGRPGLPRRIWSQTSSSARSSCECEVNAA